MILSELNIQVPPLPYFLKAGKDIFMSGHQHVERHKIGIFDLIVVSQGTLHIGEADEAFDINAGQALILRPDLHHYPTKACGVETHFYWIHFQVASPWTDKNETTWIHNSAAELNPSDLKDIGNQYHLHLQRYLSLSNPHEIYREIESLLTLIPKSDLLSCWKQQSLFHSLLFRLYGDSQSERLDSSVIQLAERTASYLKENYQQQITNERLGSELNYHPIYITRCMRAVFGCTPNEYVNDYRIEQAKILLLTTDRSIAAISSEVGFDDPPYFTRRFKKANGMSPKDYRNQFIYKGKHLAVDVIEHEE